jgi:methionyl-tRNA synthetase
MEKTNNYKRILVTSALTYANGYTHLGHIAGSLLPADIYVRYQRLAGRDVIYICGSDEHGTAIEMSAIKEGITPQEIIDKYHWPNKKAYEDLRMSFDIYSRTSNQTHINTAQDFFLDLYNKGILTLKTEKQLFSEKENRFLADRFVIGTCPNCGFSEATGDECENCGTALTPLQLINPRSKITGDTPVVKESTHFYFPLSKYQPQLEKWIDSKSNWKPNVVNYCKGWFKKGLQDRAITRDLDWGVKVPLKGYESKVIYIWFENTIGYISATKELFEQRKTPDKWKEYWCSNDTKLVHFLGKDNIIFHAIFFPAMLMAHGDFVLADNVPANEFMNLEGSKQSKSRGHAIYVRDVVNKINPDTIRYTIASNMPENRDTDFYWEDLQAKNNNELGAILGNFINRTYVFAEKYFDSKVPQPNEFQAMEIDLFDKLKNSRDKISELYENYKFKEALAESMNAVRDANKYFNDSEPWVKIKNDKKRCETIINVCLQLVHSFAVLFSPVLPFTSEKILKMLNKGIEDFSWNKVSVQCLKPGHLLNKSEILFSKIEDSQIKEFY